MAPSDTVTPDLWNIAKKRLTSAEEARLKASGSNNSLVQGLHELVLEKQQQYNSRRWTLKRSNNEEIVVSVIFEKIAGWIQKFREIGDIATQYDPVHVALPWAGVRMLLQITINDVESLATLAEGIETISSLITRCALLENIHLAPHRDRLPKAHAMLQDGLVSLYAAILAWLSAAGSYYDKRTIVRWLRGLSSSRPTLAPISREERKVSLLATSLHDQLTSTTARAVDSLGVSFESLMAILRDLQHPMTHVAGTLTRIDESLEAKKRQQLVEWLSVIQHQHAHKSVKQGLIKNTGEWLLQKPEYTEWQESSASSTLWLRGVPGCGKSKLSSLVVQEHLRHVDLNPNAMRVAFCYCSRSYIQGSESSHRNVMASILMQLAFLGSGRGVHHSLWDEFSRRVKDAQGLDPTPLTVEDCQRFIILVTADYPVTVIIDGLDEYEGDVRDLLDTLQRIMDGSQNPVKLFVSSREDTPVEDYLHRAKSIRITRAENEKDISTFIETKVRDAVQYKKLLRGKVSPGLETQIIQRLTEGAGEMFLWASLNLQQLCGPGFQVEADVVEALEGLRAPPTLLQTLEQIYQHVQGYESNGRQIANTIFGWLLVSERQLSNAELQDILLSTTNGSIEEFDANFIHNLCRGFVNCDNVAGSFAFAHESIQEFLRGKDEFHTPKLQSTAFSLCLRCLTERYDNYHDTKGVFSNDTPTHASKDLQPFVDGAEDGSVYGVTTSFWRYAVFYWLRHYANMSPDSRASADPDVLEFTLGRKGFKLHMWQKEMLSLLEQLKQEEDAMNNITLLRQMSSLDTEHRLEIFVASIYGIPTILEKLEGENKDLNWCEKNNQGASSLYLSSVYGQDYVLLHLLVRGVDPNLAGGRFGTPIQAAAYRGHPNAVGILLMHGANSLQEGLFPTALHAAFAGGHESVIQSLINNDACHTAELLGSLIQCGFMFGHHDAVISLLRFYFKDETKMKNLQDECKSPIPGIGGALQAALYETNNDASILSLLERTPDINESGGIFGNALRAACLTGSARWVRLLLERGADANSIGHCGSALRAASFGGHNEVVRLLLERGAALGPDNKDALEACALRNHLSTLKLLINHFQLTKISDYNECKWHFGAAMRTARRERRYRIIGFMLENGAKFLRREAWEDSAKVPPIPMLDIFINDTSNVRDRIMVGGDKK